MPDKFRRRYGDLMWGKFDYPVTPTQKKSLDGVAYVLGFSPGRTEREAGFTYFYSQDPYSGEVIIGQNHRSLNVNRDGRITSNG